LEALLLVLVVPLLVVALEALLLVLVVPVV